MKLWPISNYADLQGIGGLRASGRWHTRGRPIVYLAESPPGALIEVLVHVDVSRLEDLPDRYTLLTIEADGDIGLESCVDLPDDWAENRQVSRAAGDRWLEGARSALLRVPSAIMPGIWNVLLNPLHPDAHRLRITGTASLPFDRRLFKIVKP